MSVSLNNKLPRRIAEKLEQEAKKLPEPLENHILELALRDLDPDERVLEYLEAAKTMLEQAEEELDKGEYVKQPRSSGALPH